MSFTVETVQTVRGAHGESFTIARLTGALVGTTANVKVITPEVDLPVVAGSIVGKVTGDTQATAGITITAWYSELFSKGDTGVDLVVDAADLVAGDRFFAHDIFEEINNAEFILPPGDISLEIVSDDASSDGVFYILVVLLHK